jgi:hypothetical protein
MRTSETTAEVFAAIVAANEKLTNPPKTQDVSAGQKRYSFAPLPEIIDLVRPVLREYGLAVVQEAKADPGHSAGVATRIIHTSGEWIEFDPLFLPSALDAQGFGSATTYARRYQLCAALGIAADEDDDAEEATKNVGSGTRDHSTRSETAVSQDAAANAVVPDPTPPDSLDALIHAYGSSGKAMLAARALWPDTKNLASLNAEDRAALIEIAQKMAADV